MAPQVSPTPATLTSVGASCLAPGLFAARRGERRRRRRDLPHRPVAQIGPVPYRLTFRVSLVGVANGIPVAVVGNRHDDVHAGGRPTIAPSIRCTSVKPSTARSPKRVNSLATLSRVGKATGGCVVAYRWSRLPGSIRPGGAARPGGARGPRPVHLPDQAGDEHAVPDALGKVEPDVARVPAPGGDGGLRPNPPRPTHRGVSRAGPPVAGITVWPYCHAKRYPRLGEHRELL
jgi:hypothetical protein